MILNCILKKKMDIYEIKNIIIYLTIDVEMNLIYSIVVFQLKIIGFKKFYIIN